MVQLQVQIVACTLQATRELLYIIIIGENFAFHLRISVKLCNQIFEEKNQKISVHIHKFIR